MMPVFSPRLIFVYCVGVGFGRVIDHIRLVKMGVRWTHGRGWKLVESVLDILNQ